MKNSQGMNNNNLDIKIEIICGPNPFKPFTFFSLD